MGPKFWVFSFKESAPGPRGRRKSAFQARAAKGVRRLGLLIVGEKGVLAIPGVRGGIGLGVFVQ